MDGIGHQHVFLGESHAQSEARTWRVIAVCAVMMVLEIAGGLWFGSIALVADGLHMSTHAGALLLAALAYRFARKHAQDARFSFGTGKFGDLAGFTSAIILAMIAVLIAYEAVSRLFAPVQIHFNEAIPIACLGLAVNIVTAWMLSGAHDHGHEHGHGHSHGHDHGHAHEHEHEEAREVETGLGTLALEIFETGQPPRFRLYAGSAPLPAAGVASATIHRPDGSRETYDFTDKCAYLESAQEIPEPHEFAVRLAIGSDECSLAFEEHEHADAKTGRDNNMRAAVVHIITDAAVSVLVIIGLLLAKYLGWMWMDPVVGLVGAAVIASWAAGLIRDTGGILLDMIPDKAMAQKLCETIESEGDELADLHLWRLGPGHLGAILSVRTDKPRAAGYYHTRLARFTALSHLTIEVHPR